VTLPSPAIAAVSSAVDGDRLLRRLDELAAHGAVGNGGVTRIAFSPEERAARDLVAGWLRDAGLTVAYDSFGSMFGSTDGNLPDARVSMAGSHIDTVPNGGRFDGALGVVAAVESVMAMRDANALPSIPLEVVVWRCEEPVRFSQGKAGSLLFTGAITPEGLRPIEDPPFDIAAALAQETNEPRRAPDRAVAGCLELHIEQGRRLERAGRTIGVVTAIAAPIRLQVHVTGSADHSGATPMNERRDALCAAAELVLAAERAAQMETPHASVATTTDLSVRPGAMNVIPGEATALVDIRGIDATSMERVVAAIQYAAAEIGTRRAVAVAVIVLSRGSPTIFERRMVDEMSGVVRALGHDPMIMPSGAGHDVQCLASTAEAGLLFVPSVGGLSHCPEEFTAPDDMVAGVQALAACWCDAAAMLTT
jgi:hydantoinase/carbamoylase family amidase